MGLDEQKYQYIGDYKYHYIEKYQVSNTSFTIIIMVNLIL